MHSRTFRWAFALTLLVGALLLGVNAPLAVAALTNAGRAAAAPAARPPSATPAPPPGATSRIAYARLVTTGSGKTKTTDLQVTVAWPDGSGIVQVTNSGTNRPRSWSADGWMVVEDSRAGLIRILNVPTNNPAAVTQVTSFPQPAVGGGLWSAQTDGSGSVLPAAQQLLAFAEGSTAQRNIVVRRYDGSSPTAITNYTTTCAPSQNPGCSGSRYVTYLLGWLPSDSAAQTIRLLYGFREFTYVDGALTGETVALRVATLGTASWPNVTLAGDAPLLFGGPTITALNFTVSRDGTMAAYANNHNTPSETVLHVAPLEYNPGTGTTTLRSDLAADRADTTGTNYRVYYAGGFSPDNSQMVMTGADLSEFQGAGSYSVFVSSVAANGPLVEVDGSTSRQEDSAIWGP